MFTCLRVIFELRDDYFSSLSNTYKKRSGNVGSGTRPALYKHNFYLSSLRKAQVDLTEAYERADLTEQACAKYRSRGRSQSMARDY
jgi:hypothetical protein